MANITEEIPVGDEQLPPASPSTHSSILHHAQTISCILQSPPLDGVARNGPYKCGGVEIIRTPSNTILLSGLTSKSAPVNGFMELHPSTARDLATELLRILQED